MAIKRIYIEITNICNLKCAFCSGNHRAPQFMSPDDFEIILQKVKSITKYVYLHVQGEPLLSPHFDEILSICDRHEIKVQLVTNGTLISKYPHLLEHPSLRKISISLQSADFHIDTNVEEYLSKIIELCQLSSLKERPFCELRFWISDKPLPPSSAYCLSRLKEQFTFVESGRKKNYRIMPNVYVDFAEEFQWPSSQNSTSDYGTCHGAIDQLAVLVDGSVVPCCLDAEGQIIFGNLKTMTMDEILSSKRYKEMVDGFRSHKIYEPLCLHCTYRLRFNKPSK